MENQLFHFAAAGIGGGNKQKDAAPAALKVPLDVEEVVRDAVDECSRTPGAEMCRTVSQQRVRVRDKVKNDILREYRAAPHPRKSQAPRRESRFGRLWLFIRKLFGTPQSRLHAAVMAFDSEKCEKALSQLARSDPAAINRAGNARCPPLSSAVKVRNHCAVDQILDFRGVDVNARDGSELCPLHHAVHVRSKEIVARILRHEDSVVDATDPAGVTPLMMACELGEPGIVLLLLDKNAEPTKTDDQGWNALFFAAYGGDTRVVRIILDEGVDKKGRDEKHYRAADWAKHVGHGAVVSLIEGHKLRISNP